MQSEFGRIVKRSELSVVINQSSLHTSSDLHFKICNSRRRFQDRRQNLIFCACIIILIYSTATDGKKRPLLLKIESSSILWRLIFCAIAISSRHYVSMAREIFFGIINKRNCAFFFSSPEKAARWEIKSVLVMQCSNEKEKNNPKNVIFKFYNFSMLNASSGFTTQ